MTSSVVYKTIYPEVQLSKVWLSKVQVSKFQLSRIQLSRIQLSKVQLSKVQLSIVQLSKVQSSKVHFSITFGDQNRQNSCNPLIWTTKRRNEHWAISFNFIPTTPLIWSVTNAKNSIYCTTVPNLILFLFTYLSKSWLRDYYDLWNG